MNKEFTVILVKEEQLTSIEKKAIDDLNAECFADVDQKSIAEDFIAPKFAQILAYQNKKLIGAVDLFKRYVPFDGKTILLGGMGGVCVTASMRKKGIATLMLKKGLEALKQEKCDIACLNVDLEKKVYGVYEKLGFTVMERKISFENVNGQIVYDTGTMFILICSQSLYELVMNSKATFHYGRGYW